MPHFMDFHSDLKLPKEAIDDIAKGARSGATDAYGVRQIELYHNPEGKVYCLLDAPDAQAVRDKATCERRYPALTSNELLPLSRRDSSNHH